MAADEQLARESGLRMRYAVIAGLGGIALFAAAALQAVGPQPKVSELTLELITTNKRAALEVAGALINGLGLVGVGLTLNFLGQAAKNRGNDVSRVSGMVAIIGTVAAAVGGIAYGVAITLKAHQFVAPAQPQTYVQANDLVGGGLLAVFQYLGLLASLVVAIAFVLVSLQAMRVGLLSKFLGYLGMAAAAASLLLIGSAPALLVEVFWMLAVAYLLSGRWQPEPEAWRTGKAVPWPSAAELREQRQRAAGRSDGRAKPGARQPSKPASSDSEPVTTATRSRATTPKRKRKRRK